MYVEAYEHLNLNYLYDLNKKYVDLESHKKAYKNLRFLISNSGIYALIGLVGSGKTTLLNKLQSELKKDGNIIISRSLSTDKKRLKIAALFTALFYDLNTNEKDFKIPTTPEKRERELIKLFQKHNKPVVLIIDEAHDLHNQTLVSLKRLVETVTQNGYQLSILLAGHPKLRGTLFSASMEEISARVKSTILEPNKDDNETLIRNWISIRLNNNTKLEQVIDKEAISYLATELLTPLQIEFYLEKAILSAYEIGESKISLDIVKDTLYADIKSIQSNLARNGYYEDTLCDLLNITKKEIKLFFDNKLPKESSLNIRQKLESFKIRF